MFRPFFSSRFYMKTLLKIAGIITALLLLTVAVVWVFLLNQRPVLEGFQKMENLQDSVSVYFDSYGIPHIYASSETDAYRALGYVHAQDRLFQMDLMRRVGSGTLAEVFGREMLEADKFFRTLGIPAQSHALAQKFPTLPEPVRQAVEAYIDGVNQFIATGTQPLEYTLAGFEPAPYTVEDMYNILGYMSYSFAFALRTDPLVERIAQELGPEYLTDIETDYVKGTAVIPVRGNSYVMDTLSGESRSRKAVADILDRLPVPVFHGSNSWVLAPWRSQSKKVLLANDAHIKYASPAVWYEAHLEYPGTSFYGNHLAGIPFGIIGHTMGYGWGLTMFENDDNDFFLETLVPDDASRIVYFDSSSAPIVSVVDTILIKDEDPLLINLKSTPHGPVMNEFIAGAPEAPVSMYWTYLKTENNLLPVLYRMSHAVNKNDFRSAVAQITAPGLSIIYGDTAGNIALWAAAKMVKRPTHIDGKQYIDGSKSANEYLGYYNFEENPQMENPKWGYLYSANNQYDTTAGILYPGYYAPENRAVRITGKLNGLKKATLDSLKILQLDVTSTVEARTANEMAQVLLSSEIRLQPEEFEALKILAAWDGGHQLDAPAPVIYYKWLYYILEGTLADELGEEAFRQMLTTHLIKRTYPVLLQKQTSKWWDDISTPETVEQRPEIFATAWQRTWADLNKNPKPAEDWKWKQVHFIKHPHPLGSVDLLSTFFNVGPFPAPGGNETVNNASFTFTESGNYVSEYGPSMRILIDFADLENSLSVLPTGNSGNVMSPHYKDQAALFLNGQYRKQMMNRNEIIEQSSHLLLLPQ